MCVKKKNNVVILGGTGLLGPYIESKFQGSYNVIVFGRKHGKNAINIKTQKSIEKIINKYKPSILINLIAQTNVDFCEVSKIKAAHLNSLIPRFIARSLNSDTLFIQVSTDQVYNGESGFNKEDSADPINVYGKTKLIGEKEACSHKKTLVLRTNIFGKSKTERRESLSDFFIRSLASGKKVLLFEDSVFSPLHMETLANYVKILAESSVTGVYNLGSNEPMSKAEFACTIARRFKLSIENTQFVKSSLLSSRAKRPLDLSLNNKKVEKILLTSLPTLKEEIYKL